ncbi:protein GLE1 isoform X2 [Jatropha curcas]|uniref:protein GLE1 isoform X2 n=1 Tax=Jatropha curcas TaxID=180498 RepID=UPI0018962159|nr:protein GLE1 isoform X2 [Jatropha curcas]
MEICAKYVVNCWFRGFSSIKSVEKSSMAFIMRVSDDEMEDSEEEAMEDSGRTLVTGKRFNCDDIYISESDDSDYELAFDEQSYLMDGVGVLEGALFERSQEHQLGVKEELRNQISALEIELMRESEKSDSASMRVEKYVDARRESDRKFDTQYQRKIAEALDNHLTAIQRDHELKSQIEERRIRNDAANEEAKRREKALQEERLRQERARAEAEAKRKVEEAKMAALEAERRAAKEAAEKEAAEASKRIAAVVSQGDVAGHDGNVSSANSSLQSQEAGSNGSDKPKSAGDIMRAAKSARNLEQGRLQKLKMLDDENQSLRLSSKLGFSGHEKHILRLMKQISGTKENVSAKSSELIKIFKNPACPQSISIVTFAEKVVSLCTSPAFPAFACSHVVVLVISQVPHAMDILLAKLHKACVYTVPKYIAYSKSAFDSRVAYLKTIGYEEHDGKIESTEEYLQRLESYMRLYGALVQTEVQGVQNPHGPKEGWAWLARFLNTLPANKYTAVALKAFLQTAGFVLFRKYRSQFRKLLNIILKDFLKVLRESEDSELRPIIIEIQSYIEDNEFIQEPEGRSLQGSLLSKVMAPGSQPSRSYYDY